MIKNVNISFWFKELNNNPKDKIEELSQELKEIIDTPFMFNEEKVGHLIGMPRIKGMSSDKKYLFTMSLINANLVINFNDKPNEDAVVLLINQNILLLFDILKEIYDLDILYTSIKIEIVTNDKMDDLKEKLKLKDRDYEDLSLKRGFIKDDYYINYTLNLGKEFTFNINKDDNTMEQDIFDRMLLISLKDAKITKEFVVKIIEINDRYAYNRDNEYKTTKNNLRGMIIELKDILKNKSYDDI